MLRAQSMGVDLPPEAAARAQEMLQKLKPEVLFRGSFDPPSVLFAHARDASEAQAGGAFFAFLSTLLPFFCARRSDAEAQSTSPSPLL